VERIQTDQAVVLDPSFSRVCIFNVF